MYESHFGLSGPPFLLSPDPSFFFGSKGHGSALSHLKRGIDEADGFVVLSGEIGTGKTTLVRALMRQLDSNQVVAAQIVNTQLDCDELLLSILRAFDIPITEPALRGQVKSALEAFRARLVETGRKALLIVDEAQNLHQDAFELLYALSSPKPGGRSLLQCCLVGEPELRTLLESAELQSFRKRIIVSRHLGPLDRQETRTYIEHRLHKVGWTGRPSFEPNAFDEIFSWTSGVPRRINLLCNRLMLSRFLASELHIDAAVVEQTARDLRIEIEGPAPKGVMPSEVQTVKPPTVARMPVGAITGKSKDRLPFRRSPELPEAGGTGPVLCVVGGLSDYVKAAPLLHAFSARADLPATLLVRAHRNAAFPLSQELFAGFEACKSYLDLDIQEHSDTAQTAEAMNRFASIVKEYRPRAVLVIGSHDAALACSIAASKMVVPVVRIGAGRRSFDRSEPGEMNRVLIDQISNLLYTTDERATENLASEGIPITRIRCAGNILVDALQSALRMSIALSGALARTTAPEEFLQDKHGYGLVTLSKSFNVEEQRTLSDLVNIVRQASVDVPLIWPMHPHTRSNVAKFGLDALIATKRIVCPPLLPYPEMIGLMSSATCVLTDSWNVQDEAAALAVPCLTLGAQCERMMSPGIGSRTSVGTSGRPITHAVWEIVYSGGKRAQVPRLWDGQTAVRVANHLASWLSRPADSTRANPDRWPAPIV
jgi:general secretion pathway protein A